MDALAEAAEGLAHQLGNENFDAATNGEHRLLRLLGTIDPTCVFDVGANTGEWCRAMTGLYPSCEIHAFEIVPSTAAMLGRAMSSRPKVRVNPFGLSDHTGMVAIHVPDENASTMATAFPAQGMKSLDGSDFYKKTLHCETRRAAEYVAAQGIRSIDFVKIDVEGMDLRVIKGFGEELSRVRLLQFEYGAFNVPSHDLLCDFVDHLGARGFVVGKIYPRIVQFFEYTFKHDNFYGANYVAVRRDESALIRRLATYGG